MTARALSLLAAFASPVFMAAAIAGWLSDVLPANPLTFGVAAVLVIGGPILGIVHVATSSEDDEEDEEDEVGTAVIEPPPAALQPLPPPPPVLSPRAAAAERFGAWRDAPPTPALERRI